MPDFYVFYYRHRTGDMICAHAPKPIPTDHIAPLAGSVLEGIGDFLGLVDRDDSVLQFIYVDCGDDDERPIRMEIPDVDRKESLTRYISNDELLELLRNLPGRLTTEMFADRGAESP